MGGRSPAYISALHWCIVAVPGRPHWVCVFGDHVTDIYHKNGILIISQSYLNHISMDLHTCGVHVLLT
jgi:hypothetical protein